MKFRNLFNTDLRLEKLLESTEAFACCIFDKGLLQSTLVDVDQSNFDSLGQFCCRFLGPLQAGLRIYVKFDSEVDTLELIFETDKREFCASINKHKYIDQDKLEWSRLLNYWMGLLNRPKLLEQTFNQSLAYTGLPKSIIEWDSNRFQSGILPTGDRDRSEKIFLNLLFDIYDSLRFRFNLNAVGTSAWKYKYWSPSKYGYELQIGVTEVQLFVSLNKLRLLIYFKDSEKVWLDLPPEILKNYDKNLQLALVESFVSFL